MIKFILSFIFLFHVCSASAQDIPHLDSLQKIVDAGIVRIGNVDLRRLIEEAKGLKVHLNSGSPITAANQDRKSAKNSRLSKEVYINQQVIASHRQFKGSNADLELTLYFHEYLGALGYRDYNYELSSILSFTHLLVELAEIRPHFKHNLEIWKHYLSKLFFDKLPPITNFTVKSGGGSTTTEGGGDYSPALYKSALLYELMYSGDNLLRFNPQELAVLRFILDLKIEVDWNMKWTPRNVARMNTVDNNWILWLPINFTLEAIAHTLNPSNPESMLRYVIRPTVRKNIETANLIIPPMCKSLLSGAKGILPIFGKNLAH